MTLRIKCVRTFTHLSLFCVGRWYFHSFESSLCSTLVFSLIPLCSTLLFSLISHFSCRMSKKRPKRNTPFQSRHDVEFGLRICERSAGASTTVVTRVCQFCKVFGKEEAVVGSKHSCSECVKYFKAPFRKENFSSHNKRMHSAK